MNRISNAVGIGFLLTAALPALPAQALNARSFVSGHGSDAAACTLAAPCRTLAHALTQTNAGGEIDVLDAAGYGALTIDRAISIVNDGVGTAGVIVPSAGIGITINAGANDAVSLRGLSVEGGGTGATGIQFNTGASLTVENCVIRHVTQDGLDFLPTATSSLSVSNSLMADNGNNGISVVPSGSGAVTAVFNRVQANNNGTIGISVNGSGATGALKATVYDSVAAGNVSAAGFYAQAAPGQAPTTLMLFHSVAANNAYGLIANGIGATVRIANSMVTGNAIGWQAFSGVVQSYGNNAIDGNDGGEAAPPTTALK